MTSASHTLTTTAADHQRLRLKPDAPTTGVVDGAWWPESRDLAAELPAGREGNTDGVDALLAH